MPHDIRTASVWYRPSERTLRAPDFFVRAGTVVAAAVRARTQADRFGQRPVAYRMGRDGMTQAVNFTDPLGVLVIQVARNHEEHAREVKP